MKLSGSEAVEIAKLATAPGFTARNDSPRTIRLVQRLRRGAALDVPVITKDHRLAVGEAVVAAHIANGATHVRAYVLDCTQKELELLRRYDARSKRTRAMDVIKQLIDLTEPEVDSLWMAKGFPVDGSHTARAEARKWVGEALGINARNMRDYDRLERRGQAKPEKVETVWELNCHGWEPAPGLLDEAKMVHTALRAVDARLRLDQADLAPLVEHLTAFPGAGYAYGILNKMASWVRSKLPAHICPYCKSTVAVRLTCLACSGAGWVNEDGWKVAPEALRTEFLVSHAGQLLDPVTLQPPVRYVHRGPKAVSFVGNDYSEEEEL